MSKIKSLTDIPAIAAYFRRVGAEARSLRTGVVMEKAGKYWKDQAVLTIDNETGIVHCPDPQYAPTDAEQLRITDEVKNFEWPRVRTVKNLMSLPDELKDVPRDDIFEFKNLEGDIVMLQVRLNIKDEKKYIPWTYWDDDEWRKMEPDGHLPLWGLDQLKDHTTVFIHEGAKAARSVRRMVEAETADQLKKLKAHPWGEELSGAAHIGWIGGAWSPWRTDWKALKQAGVKRAYIVSDNDFAGKSAVPHISHQLRMPTFHVQFTQDWPASFDLADEFPDKMFKSIENSRYYVGPTFRSVLHPATWATDSLPNPKGGRPTILLREHFKDMWAYIEEVDMYVCIDMPEIIRTEPVMNKLLSSFSHSSTTSTLMAKAYAGRSPKLCYRPDVKGRIITDKTTSAINLHTPCMIKSAKGSIKPFLDFMEYLFPLEDERKEVMRWCATLIAKPEVKMHYALLLVSEKQGVGKTTLGQNVLAPLVGDLNVSFPAEKEIVDSAFNSWIANKRLIVIGEIYSGHSWKAYNNLKGLITDRDIEVNQKYMRPYRLENWAHFFVCSNSRRALKMENDDRRWYYPTVTEVPWPRAKFAEFNAWLDSGGLGIIRHWAEGYGDYVLHGARAPMTSLKQELIEASRSEAQKEVADLAKEMVEDKRPIAIAMKELEAWVRTNIAGRIFDSDHELRKTMCEIGCYVAPKRVKIGGRLQYVIMNPVLQVILQAIPDEVDYYAAIRKHAFKPSDIIAESM